MRKKTAKETREICNKLTKHSYLSNDGYLKRKLGPWVGWYVTNVEKELASQKA